MDNKRELSFKRASFIKVIEDEFTKKLQIPQAFTKIFEERIPPWLILEIAGTRKCWRVDIEEDGNGGLFLSCGFDCFAKANSLEVGNFLLFELEEPSILQVKIYEKDGSEKTTVAGTTTFEYEVGPFEFKRQTPTVHQKGESSPWPTMPPSVQYGAYEKKKNITDGIKRKRGIVSDTKHGLRFSLIWRKAKHFTYYLTIPKAIVRGKIFSDKDAVILQDQEGKNWRVELKLRPDGRLDFAQGWRDFVKDNELRTGDTLVFEFVSNNVIQVHVGRASQLDHNRFQREQDCKIEPTERNNMACENDQELPANCTMNNNAPVTGVKYEPVTFGSQSPSFSFTWKQKTKNNSYLHVPKAIASRQKLQHKDIVVLCDPQGRKWLMEARTRQTDGRVGFYRGWVDFSKAYGFRAGDTLVFEFVSDRTMKVQIIKACNLNEHAVTTGPIVKPDVIELH